MTFVKDPLQSFIGVYDKQSLNFRLQPKMSNQKR